MKPASSTKIFGLLLLVVTTTIIMAITIERNNLRSNAFGQGL
ncbi:MAG TPA: hypothetical protein VD815_05605 [Candidatus Saccharimonadales bacterium]|nr:hypothetical protein [Candidatus Saccharimonadales bacterium]